jgi:dihydrolipoamide dehydrogenase
MVDLIVVGGGPGGYLGAERAAHAGLKTLLIEKREVGGVCLNEGCIPTKTLLYSAKIKEGAAHGEIYGVKAAEVSIDHPAVVKRKNKVVAALVGGVKAKLKAAGVTLIGGEAYLLRRGGEGFEVGCGDERYTGKRLLICTGSVPVVPPIPGLKEAVDKGFAVTSREMLDIQKVPSRLAIVGGGVIGLEMANYFAAAGAQVTVIEMLDAIGGAIDADISAILQKNLEKKGIRFLLGHKVTQFKNESVACEGKDGAVEIEADTVLLSIGRRAFTEGLGLENLGVLT